MNQGPYAIVLTRQNLPALDHSSDQALKGGYIIHAVEDPQGVIIATGSEVHIAIEAAKVLQEKGKYIQVVSMPSLELFESQDIDYIEKVLPPVYTLAVEAGSTLGWYKYADDVLGIDRFGASGPANRLFEEFGFTVDNIVSYFE